MVKKKKEKILKKELEYPPAVFDIPNPILWAQDGIIEPIPDEKYKTGWEAEIPPFEYMNWWMRQKDQQINDIDKKVYPLSDDYKKNDPKIAASTKATFNLYTEEHFNKYIKGPKNNQRIGWATEDDFNKINYTSMLMINPSVTKKNAPGKLSWGSLFTMSLDTGSCSQIFRIHSTNTASMWFRSCVQGNWDKWGRVILDNEVTDSNTPNTVVRRSKSKAIDTEVVTCHDSLPLRTSNGKEPRGAHFTGKKLMAFMVWDGNKGRWHDSYADTACAAFGNGELVPWEHFPVTFNEHKGRFKWIQYKSGRNNACDIVCSTNPKGISNSIPLDDAVILLDPEIEKELAGVFKERHDGLIVVPKFDLPDNNLFYFLKTYEKFFAPSMPEKYPEKYTYPKYINIWNTSTKQKYRIDEKLLKKLSFEFTRLEPEHVYDVWDKKAKKWVSDKKLKKEYDLKILDGKYNPIFNELGECFNKALLFEQTGSSKEIQEEAKRVMNEYLEKKKKIEDNETPQDFTYERKFCPRCGSKLVNHVCPKCGWKDN